MKFSADVKVFRQAVAAAGKVVGNKVTIPIFGHLKLVTNDDRVTLVASNMEITLEQTVPCDVATEGATCIPFAPLAAFCAAAKGDSIEIAVANGQVAVKCGRGRIALATMPAEDFPIYMPSDGAPVTLDAATFCKALRFCAGAASDEETRYYLNGPFVQEYEGHVEVWGTDGHAMHHAVIPDLPTIGGGGIVPMGAVAMILAIAEKAGTAEVMICERGWTCKAGATAAWGKVIDGTFPDARRALAQFNGGLVEIATVTKADMTAALTMAACGADTLDKAARGLVIRADTGKPIIVKGAKGASGVVAAGRAEMDARAKATAACAVSSALLSGALGVIGADDVTVWIDGEGRAVWLEPAQQSATMRLEALVMGMRATESEMADE